MRLLSCAAVLSLIGLWSSPASADVAPHNFENCVYYNSEDVPKDIIDDGSTTTISELPIAESFTITDINVRVDISHNWTADLDVFLESPTGTLVELFTDVGGGSQNFTNTTLDDQAVLPITSGTAPFTGCFSPEGSLADLNGEDAQGTWKLRVLDDFSSVSGTLNSWRLEFDCPCSDLEDGEYQSGDVPQDIPDDGSTALTSTIEVLDSFSVGEIDVKLTIHHTWVSDLDVTLTSPTGTIVELFSDVGGSGDDFIGTRLDDDADTAITAGSAPFTGTYSPEGLLLNFSGEEAQGTWTLTVFDDFQQETGTLENWAIVFSSGSPEIEASPAVHDYGYHNIEAGPSEARDFTISNTGNATLNISDISLRGTNASEFSITAGGGPQTVEASATHIVSVVFNPETASEKVATLRIDSDDSDEPVVGIALSGEGFDPAVGVTSPVYVDFAQVGEEEGTQTLPFNTVAEGAAFVTTSGQVRIEAGQTDEIVTIDKPMALETTGGTVTIGVVP